MQGKAALQAACIVVVIVMIGGVGVMALSAAEDCPQARALVLRAGHLRVGPQSGTVQTMLTQEQLYQQAIALCPRIAAAHNDLGDLYEKRGWYADAIRAYEQAVAARPSFVLAYYGLGDVYLRSADYAAAIAAYTAGLQRDTRHSSEREISLIRRGQAKLLQKATTGHGRHILGAKTLIAFFGPITRAPGKVVKINSLSFGELIPFAMGQCTVRADARVQLDELGRALSSPALSAYSFEIAGHTDVRGAAAANLKLSLCRAEAVRDYLVRHFALPSDRLCVRGYGERRPLAQGTDPVSHALNRRVEIMRVQDTNKSNMTLSTSVLYRAAPTGLWRSMGPNGRTVLRTHTSQYQIFFRPQQTSYVYVLQKDASGAWTVLFPSMQAANGRANPVQARKKYWLPAFGRGFQLDGPPGQETVYIVASHHPIPALLAAARGVEIAPLPRSRALEILLTSGVVKIVPETTGDVEGTITQVTATGGFVWMVSFLHRQGG